MLDNDIVFCMITHSRFIDQCFLQISLYKQVSRTLLSILTDINNAVVWTVSTRSIISKSSSLRINPLLTVPRAPITIIIDTFIFDRFFQFPSKGHVLILLFAFFQLYSVIRSDSKVHNSVSSLSIVVEYYKVYYYYHYYLY